MNVEDAVALALLVIGGRNHEAADQAVCNEDRRDPREPRRERRRQLVDVRRRAKLVKPRPGHRVRYSRLMRTAAAAASGASVMPRMAMAPRSCTAGMKSMP